MGQFFFHFDPLLTCYFRNIIQMEHQQAKAPQQSHSKAKSEVPHYPKPINKWCGNVSIFSERPLND
jgi:hypothetical protein